jgi:hypothetical protein
MRYAQSCYVERAAVVRELGFSTYDEYLQSPNGVDYRRRERFNIGLGK